MLCLETVVILKSEFCNLGLAVRAFLPAYLRALITTDVYIFGREELADLCEDILKELHCLLLSDAEDVVSDAPFAPYVVWAACTSELWVSSESREHMARKIDLRNDRDALAGSIVKNLPYLVLCEVASLSVRSSVIDLAVEKVAYESLLSYSSHLCQAWIFLDLESPSLVVCNVPVEGVELVHFHDVKVSLYLIHVEEVA